MTKQELLDNGFRRHDPVMSKWATDLFQRRIDDENGIRYFINVWYYQDEGYGEVWMTDVHFNDGCAFHPMACLKVEAYSVADWSVDDLLKWADELWTRLVPNYYERWR